MNAIAIKTKTVEVVPARTVNISAVTWRTSDDAFQRKLQVIVNGMASFQIEGEAYEALGQWTDETIRDLILARFGMELATA
jgi:hypothetical protein